MLKTLLILLLTTIALPTLTMKENNFIEVTVSCAKELEKIKSDGGILYYYLQGVWLGAAEHNLNEKPSIILQYFVENSSDINSATQLRHMPAGLYLKKVLSKKYRTLDTLFLKTYEENESYSKSWNAVNNYLSKENFAKIINEYKAQIIEEDKKNL